MNTKKQFSEILEALGGTKLNVRASEDRNLSSEDIINKNIKLIKENFNSQIPSDYLSFIKEISAITFNESVNSKGIEKIPVADNKNQIGVDNFFDFFEDDASIIQVLNSFKGNIPDHVLPICEGEAGDLIVINMAKKNYGKVYYWHHEHEDEIEGLYMIANDFKQFITNLYKASEDDVSTDGVAISKVSNKFLERLKKSGKFKTVT